MRNEWNLSRAPLSARVRARTSAWRTRVGEKPLSPRTGGRISGVVESARDWAAETPGASYATIRPAETRRRPEARTVGPPRHDLFESLRCGEHPEVFRVTVPRARIVDFYARLVLTDERRLLAESAAEHVRARPPTGRRLHAAQYMEGRYIALLNQWSESHFHWIADTLPRASLLPPGEDASTPIIVPAGMSGAQLSSLAMVGIAPERLVPFDRNHLQVEELVLPSFVGRPGFPPGWAAAWLRERVAPVKPATRRRLWVSRAAAPRRGVANEHALLNILDRYGFEPMQPERHSFAQQIQLFAEAEMIAGPHGSALSNMIAARDATVIELFNERRWGNGCFYAFSDALGLDYWYLRCEAVRGEHLWVEPALLEATLEAALGGDGAQ